MSGPTRGSHATDGVVLISQVTAVMSGFPIKPTQPGNYRLSGDLLVPDANCTAILITTDDVRLDFGGYSILRPTACSRSPASCTELGYGTG